VKLGVRGAKSFSRLLAKTEISRQETPVTSALVFDNIRENILHCCMFILKDICANIMVSDIIQSPDFI
jgi:hypothetical protein